MVDWNKLKGQAKSFISEAQGKHEGYGNSPTFRHTPSGPQHCSPSSMTTPPKGEELPIQVEELGTAFHSDSEFKKQKIGRDGGGGGTVNGCNIVLYSDTLVNGVGPLTCTIAYSSPDDPRCQQDFGNGGVPKQGIPYIPEEDEFNKKKLPHSRIAIWPQSAIVNLPGDDSRGIAIAPVSLQSTKVPGKDLYNTLYTITAGDCPKVERTVPKLWHEGGVMWGTFTTMLNPLDNMLYFFGNDGKFMRENSGLKVARADPRGNYTDTSTWTFWDGKTWVNNPPGLGQSPAAVDGLYSSGEVFYSQKYKTFLVVYFNGFADSTFRYRYALPDGSGNVSITGKWSKEYVLYDTNHLKMKEAPYGYNFAGHAYPTHDPSGETLILSCTLSDGGTTMWFRARLG